MTETGLHVFISGRVQGVGFRAFTRRNARRLGVRGWVKNLADGRVEAVLYGEKSDVEELLTRIKTGPSLAEVEDIEVEEVDEAPPEENFQVRY
ncbi:acylphosphatase [Halarsenatibacter silvermanii]|uniref:Acylphosphatase n=1 Tax=Halarsenatibacter silvermanii TaxID=321763 RepID=A0A1G9LKJ7_9FIRM|nr:acylphosphatase [Halarsenatibacter silvermanii]SDL62460.1 acylphosphatase [Halarsenatibacter silvermanii]